MVRQKKKQTTAGTEPGRFKQAAEEEYPELR